MSKSFQLAMLPMNPTEHVELKRQVDLKLSHAKVVKNTSINRVIDESPIMRLLMV